MCLSLPKENLKKSSKIAEKSVALIINLIPYLSPQQKYIIILKKFFFISKKEKRKME